MIRLSALGTRSVTERWIALAALSALVTGGLSLLGLPAALLLAPMFAGIAFGVNGIRVDVPAPAYLGAQGIIGAMVASAITPTIVSTLVHGWLLFLSVVAATLVGAGALGWLISRARWIPGPTAVYGTSPGAATAMVLLAEGDGADARLVAFMQYARVLLVAMGAALVARLWPGVATDHAQPSAAWFGAVQWSVLAADLVAIVVAQQVARRLHVQAWAILGPMFLLSILHAGGWLAIALPRWLLVATYTVIGWRIGLGFSRDELIHARNVLLAVIGAAITLMAFCGLLAFALVWLAHIDALTAYLATSPGGLDSVAIIASSTPGTDLSFILALQSVRLLFVIACAPSITRFVLRRSAHLRKD